MKISAFLFVSLAVSAPLPQTAVEVASIVPTADLTIGIPNVIPNVLNVGNGLLRGTVSLGNGLLRTAGGLVNNVVGVGNGLLRTAGGLLGGGVQISI